MALTASTSWQADHDLDIHLVQSDANGAFVFNDPDNDLYWNNTEPDWGSAGSALDDPFFYGDDTDGFGPERVGLAQFDSSKKYRVGVQYSRRDGNFPFVWDTDLDLTVRAGGMVINQTLTHRFGVNDEGDIWVVYEIDGSNGAVTVVDTIEQP